MFTLPNDVDHLVQWIKNISGAAPNTPAVYYHIPICTKVTCKFMIYLLELLNAGRDVKTRDSREYVVRMQCTENAFFAVPLPELLPKAAAQVPNFVGAKFTSKDCGEAGNCLRLKRPNNGKPFLFFFGSDEVMN